MAAVADNVRRYDELRPVLVLHEDERWYRGFCEGWSRRDDGTWMASVTYTVAVGEKYVRSVPPERVRPDV